MSNPLARSAGNSNKNRTCVDPKCICHFPSKQAWMASRNAELAEKGLMWIIGEAGDLQVVEDESVARARRKKEKEAKEAERQKFNWRLLHPIGEPLD